MKYIFAGDCMVQQPFNLNYLEDDLMNKFIKSADVRYFNLETTLNELGTCPGNQFSGGSYLRASRECLDSVLKYDFNVTSFNNNHAFDFTVDGFISTIKTLNEYKLPFSGTGYDLVDATKPAVIESNGKKCAIISVCSTFDNSMVAGKSSPCFNGRPGINGLHIKKKLIVTREQMNMFIKLAKDTGINAVDDGDRKDGYLLPLAENEFSFDGLMMEIGEKSEFVYFCDENDKQRIKASIIDAKKNYDEVVISYHTHEQIDADISVIPVFQEDFCRFCVDCGADIVVCHGPHLIRGIEVYNNRPIFYSIGNFIMQLNSIPEAPADFYDKYNVDPKEGIAKLLDVRSNGGKRGLMYKKVMFEAIVPYVEMKDGKLVQIKLMPIELGFDKNDETKGLPRRIKNPDFIDRIRDLSSKYGTSIYEKNGEFFVEVK